MSLEDSRLLAQALGVSYREIPIEPMFDAFLAALKEEFSGMKPDTTEENIQARVRGVLLMAISNKTGKIVLTTGNKSEMAVGYATLYGDMAGGFAAIKDVPKTLVYRLAEWRNRVKPVIPRRIIERPPSAELAPDQKDTDSLPPYATLDPILERYVERDQRPAEIVAAGFDAATVQPRGGDGGPERIQAPSGADRRAHHAARLQARPPLPHHFRFRRVAKIDGGELPMLCFSRKLLKPTGLRETDL